MNIGVLISGGGTNLQAIIDNVENGFIPGKITCVISNKKSAFGLQRAENHKIPGYFVSRKSCVNDEEFDAKIMEILHQHNVQLIVLAGYMRILTTKFVNSFPYKIINVHPSLIPSFCGDGFYGEKVHQAALAYGVRVTGATVHFVNAITDNGPIILQESVPVLPGDTWDVLQKRVLVIEHKLLPLAVKLICENKVEVIEKQEERPVIILH